VVEPDHKPRFTGDLDGDDETDLVRYGGRNPCQLARIRLYRIRLGGAVGPGGIDTSGGGRCFTSDVNAGGKTDCWDGFGDANWRVAS
jgi:hypothetical protein